MTSADARPVTVVGIGEDGWEGLPPASVTALREADVVLGSRRQVDLVAGHVRAVDVWPSPMSDALPGLLERYSGRRLAVLASGDPLLHGVGSTLVRLFGPTSVHVLPQVSSVSLACARLGWPGPEVDVVSLVGQPYDLVHRWLQPGRRLLLLVGEADSAARIAQRLTDRGWSQSPITVLERLGGPGERRLNGTAATWGQRQHDPLAIVAVSCAASSDVTPLPLVPGLPDEVFDSDGVLTKREVRAVTMAALAPLPGQLLWDVGAGSGSIAVEWMRTDPRCRAVAVEARADRCGFVTANAAALGVPGLRLVHGRAPAALTDLPTPDAVFIGGGMTTPGVVDECLNALPEGGRLVVNGVTIEAEGVLADWRRRRGGTLTRIEVSRAGPLGSFSSYRPAQPVTQWAYLQGSR